MDLKNFYNKNIKKLEYHYKFYEIINNPVKIYDYFSGNEEVKYVSYKVYDDEEAICKFKKLCQPEIEFDDEDRNWFYLITYYLHKRGFILENFPRILARPPMDPSDFTYGEIRNYLIDLGQHVDGTVKYATRRTFVGNFKFVKQFNHINIDDSLNKKIMEISTRGASFYNMSIDEKLASIANLIEHFLKKDGKYIDIDYSKLCYDYISDKTVIDFRKRMQCFRHATDKAMEERKSYSKEQKEFFLDYGIVIIKSIDSLLR